MVFSKGLALKTTGALAAASATSAGLYYVLDDMNKLSKYDLALIEFLREDGKKNDIVFEIKKDGSEDFKDSHLTISSTTKLTVKASITISNGQISSNQTFFTTKDSSTTAASEESLEKIKELNTNGWTWECNIEFSKTGSQTEIEDDYKKAIFSGDKKGLFGILKTKISEQEDNNKWNKHRRAKVEFIKKCGGHREDNKNEEYNNKTKEETSLIITSLVPFKLDDEKSKLIPKNKRTFTSWFKKEYWETAS